MRQRLLHLLLLRRVRGRDEWAWPAGVTRSMRLVVAAAQHVLRRLPRVLLCGPPRRRGLSPCPALGGRRWVLRRPRLARRLRRGAGAEDAVHLH